MTAVKKMISMQAMKFDKTIKLKEKYYVGI